MTEKLVLAEEVRGVEKNAATHTGYFLLVNKLCVNGSKSIVNFLINNHLTSGWLKLRRNQSPITALTCERGALAFLVE